MTCFLRGTPGDVGAGGVEIGVISSVDETEVDDVAWEGGVVAVAEGGDGVGLSVSICVDVRGRLAVLVRVCTNART